MGKVYFAFARGVDVPREGGRDRRRGEWGKEGGREGGANGEKRGEGWGEEGREGGREKYVRD